MSTQRAWSLLTVNNDELQYGGNGGYQDDLTRSYRYDSDVANFKQLSVGDIVFLRSKFEVLGIACIEEISTTANSNKNRQRCPVCKATGIKLRKKSSDWRCHKCGAQFMAPQSEIVQVVAFEAIYGNTFISLLNAFPLSVLKAAILRPSDQMSIAEVDFSALEAELPRNNLVIDRLIERFIFSHSLAPEDAGVASFKEPTTDASYSVSAYVPTMLDTRKAVLRNILARRGQKKFRDGLIGLYGAACMVSGCNFLGVLEAAHIDAYRGDGHNHPENGLLLRADLHTLFDLGLLAVDPDSFEVRLNHAVKNIADYAALDGAKLRVSENIKPSRVALQNRWEIFLREA
jgi:putative restriction endonuclease